MSPVTTGRRACLLIGALVVAAHALSASAPQAPAVEMKTVTYASRDGKALLLDLYLPPRAGTARLPVIVFLHGGGWSGGTRTTGPDFSRFFARDGFAVASIEYRLTPAITFPANAEDVRTAVRWLKANASTYGLDPERVGLWGTSAGGHLAAIAGLAPRGTFEGTDNLEQASAVRCVLDAYGPVAFTAMDVQTEQEKATLQPQAPALAQAPAMRGGVVGGGAAPPPAGRGGGPVPHDAETSAESKLVGAAIQSVPDKVRIASPLTYVTAAAPPFLIMHGLADNSVPHHQRVMLYEALAAAGTDVTLRLIDELPHTFFNRSNLDELAGPFRMDVRQHPAGGQERRSVDRAGVFDVARAFFIAHLRSGR